MSDDEIMDCLVSESGHHTLATVDDLGLDHAKCQYSTGIDDSLTAGQGHLDSCGFWQVPCPTCAAQLSSKLLSKTA